MKIQISLSSTPSVLYHGTYRPLLSKIKKDGLLPGLRKNYTDSKSNKVYLASTKDEAEAFAETSDTVPEEWLDQIVILKIDVSKLNIAELRVDRENRDLNFPTYEYKGSIPKDAIKIA